MTDMDFTWRLPCLTELNLFDIYFTFYHFAVDDAVWISNIF